MLGVEVCITALTIRQQTGEMLFSRANSPATYNVEQNLSLNQNVPNYC